MIILIPIFLLSFLIIFYKYNNLNKKTIGVKDSNISINSNEIQFIYKSHDRKNETISLLTYNILTQKYMKRKSKKELSLDSRMRTIINEIKSLNPDIFCLQEANVEVYKNYFIPNFKEYSFNYCENYGSTFINLTGYKTNKYTEIDSRSLDLEDIRIEGNKGVFYMKLKNNKTNTVYSVYNVHFPWKPIYELEKCYVLNSISEFILSDNTDKVLIVGDFNSIPNSVVIRLLYYKNFKEELNLYNPECDCAFKILEGLKENSELVNKSVRRRKAERYVLEQFTKKVFKEEPNQRRFHKVLKNLEQINQNYDFQSSYSDYIKSDDIPEDKRFFLRFIDNHPPYTNYTCFFKNTIDYIFYSKALLPLKIYKIPDLNEVTKEKYLPSSKYPSDHLKLYTEFTIIN